MATTKSTTNDKQQDSVWTSTHKDVEYVMETVHKTGKDGEKYTLEQPIGKMTPVVLVTTPAALTDSHFMRLWNEMGGHCKRHDTEGKIYFEVGASDDVIDSSITQAIDFLRGMGVQAKRSIEFSPYIHRREW